MSLSSHVVELQKKHAHLSQVIEQEQRSPGSDTLQIAKLKRQKLMLKEQIQKAS